MERGQSSSSSCRVSAATRTWAVLAIAEDADQGLAAGLTRGALVGSPAAPNSTGRQRQAFSGLIRNFLGDLRCQISC